jgi:hypothetical protein
MLNVIYDKPDKKLEESETVRIFRNRDEVQLKYVEYLNNVALKGEPNHLRHPLVCEYLMNEREGIYWIDDFTIMFNHFQFEPPRRAFATVLDYSLQLTMQMIYLSTIGVTDVITAYEPWVADACYVSEHCNDMNLYLITNGTFPCDAQSERERRAHLTKGLFNFTYQGVKYTDISNFDMERKMI